MIVAGQPDGAPSWFPCNDLPADKASYRIAVTTESPYTVVANGRLVERRVGASRTTWVYEQPEPMATYLATVQIGRYDQRSHRAVVPLHTVGPPRLRRAVTHDLGRQPQMLVAFQDMFGPYPFAGYTVVVTDDDLEIPLEAQGLSVFGANHMDGRRGSERLVAHELAHQWFGNSLTVGRWQDIWLHEGFACYAEWLWSERADGRPADDFARAAWERLAALPQDLLLADPGPDLMFDDRLYKRGALTLHALRAVDRRRTVLRVAAELGLHAPPRHREHGGVPRPRRALVRCIGRPGTAPVAHQQATAGSAVSSSSPLLS